MRISTIVEGHGDQNAVPSLLMYFLSEHGYFCADPSRYGGMLAMANRVEKAKRWIKAQLVYEPECLLFIADCDDDCIAESLGAIYENGISAIEESGSSTRFAVVIFNPEFEVLFLASSGNIPDCGECPIPIETVEQRRDAKSVFSKMIGRPYKETLDQKKYTKYVDREALSKFSSGEHFLRVVDWIVNSDEQFYCHYSEGRNVNDGDFAP